MSTMSLRLEDLIKLAQKSKTNTIKTFLARKNIDINSLDYDGRNALMVMVERGDSEAVRRLVLAGADVNRLGQTGYTPLMWACMLGCVSSTRILLDVDASVDQRNENGETALTEAVKHNNVNCVEVLLSHFTDRYNRLFSFDHTYQFPAHKKRCMMAGAHVNTQTVCGKTPLMIAVGHEMGGNCIDLLLEAGADPNLMDKNQKTALMYAVDSVNFCDKDVLRDLKSSENLKKLLRAGAHINTVDVSGKTALMIACEHDLVKCVQVLIEMGADVNMADVEGKTALMMSAGRYEMAHCLSHLIKANADVNCKDSDGWTPLMHAANSLYEEADSNIGTYDRFEILRRAGADIDAVNTKGYTALMVAADSLNACTAKWLMHFKPNVNFQDKQGQTALMVVARSGHDWLERYQGNVPDSERMVDLLMSHEADPEIKDINGYKPFVQCLKDPDPCHEDAIMFLNYGAEPVLEEDQRCLLTTFCDGWCAEPELPDYTTQFIRMLVCNGYVIENLCEHNQVTPFGWALREKCMSTLCYLIANFYLTTRDLSDMRACIPQPCNLDDRFSAFITLITSNPWPLVRLAFVAVSTNLGPSPLREKRIPQTGLPPPLQKLLRFETPINRLSTHHWHTLPLNFSPNHHAFAPLIHSWPFSHLAHVEHCNCQYCYGFGYCFPLDMPGGQMAKFLEPPLIIREFWRL